MNKKNDFEKMCEALDDPHSDPIKRARGYVENYCHGDYDKMLQLKAEAAGGSTSEMLLNASIPFTLLIGLIALITASGVLPYTVKVIFTLIVTLYVLCGIPYMIWLLNNSRHSKKWQKYLLAALDDYMKIYAAEHGPTDEQLEMLTSAGQDAFLEIERREHDRHQYELEQAEKLQKTADQAQQIKDQAVIVSKVAAKKALDVGNGAAVKAKEIGAAASVKMKEALQKSSDKKADSNPEIVESAEVISTTSFDKDTV